MRYIKKRNYDFYNNAVFVILSRLFGRTFAVDGHAMIPVAMQMVMAAKNNQKTPVITIPEEGDSAKLKAVKSVINKMVVYDPNKRISAADAVDNLESAVGKMSCTLSRSIALVDYIYRW